jgi:hypothetical protein
MNSANPSNEVMDTPWFSSFASVEKTRRELRTLNRKPLMKTILQTVLKPALSTHSRPCDLNQRRPELRQVLDCGSPLPLSNGNQFVLQTAKRQTAGAFQEAACFFSTPIFHLPSSIFHPRSAPAVFQRHRDVRRYTLRLAGQSEPGTALQTLTAHLSRLCSAVSVWVNNNLRPWRRIRLFLDRIRLCGN